VGGFWGSKWGVLNRKMAVFERKIDGKGRNWVRKGGNLREFGRKLRGIGLFLHIFFFGFAFFFQTFVSLTFHFFFFRKSSKKKKKKKKKKKQNKTKKTKQNKTKQKKNTCKQTTITFEPLPQFSIFSHQNVPIENAHFSY
jgi:hypothetical protein